MGGYVYKNLNDKVPVIDDICKIEDNNLFQDPFPTCSPDQELKYIFKEKEKLIMKYQKEILDRACSSNFNEFTKYSIEETYQREPNLFLINDITNMEYFVDFNKMGCFDYDKINFIKKLYNFRVKEELNKKQKVYQVMYYCIKFINLVIYVPVMLFSIFSAFSLVYYLKNEILYNSH